MAFRYFKIYMFENIINANRLFFEIKMKKILKLIRKRDGK